MTAPRILVVTDRRPTSEAMVRALGHMGAFVHAANSAFAAFSLLGRHSIDVVFVDIDRQDDTGPNAIDLTRLVRERKPDADIIAIANAPTATIAMDVIRAGAADCFGKSEMAGQIGAFIDRIMERRRYRHERVPWPDENIEDSAIIGHDPRFIAVYKQVPRLARSNDPVLIVGERGTGKTAVARAIHFLSRGDEPLVVLESTSIAEGLAESEFFGHIKGSFTGAKTDRKGYFERAGRGTVVIDEVADLPRSAQGKLLRVLQEHEVVPVGSTTAIRIHARVIAITNRPLEMLVQAGEFRPDLYDRLLVGLIEVPPLRERRRDIPELASYFVAKAAKELQLPAPPFIVPPALEALFRRDWWGNVRELENVIKQAVLNAAQYTTPVILAEDLNRNCPPSPTTRRSHGPTAPPRSARSSGARRTSSGLMNSEAEEERRLREARDMRPTHETSRRPYQRPVDSALERTNIQRALEEAGGNRRKAAQLLNMARSYLYEKIKLYGLEDIRRG